MFHSVQNKLDQYFSIENRGSTITTELFAGLSVYLSLAYIFVLNPAILGQAGMDVSAVMFATVVASGLSTILMGLWARLPFVLAPGLEMNGFFAFVAVGTLGLSWQQALAVVFISGLLCLIFTYIPVRQKIIDGIPHGLKTAIATSVGVFVFTIGLFLSGVIIFDKGIPIAVGDLLSIKAQLLYLGFILTLVLVKRLKISFGFLIVMILMTIFARYNGIKTENIAEISPKMFDATFKLDFNFFLSGSSAIIVLLILFLIDFYGSIGKFIGLSEMTNLTDKNGNVINMQKAMGVDAVGTMLGATVGTSNIITYVESAVGITAGGRTGLTAVCAGILMLLSILVTPLVSLVPVEATAGILCYVGYSLLPKRQELKNNSFDLFVAACMGLISFATFGLDKAMLFGFVLYTIKSGFNKDERVNIYTLSSALLLSCVIIGRYYFES